MVRGRIALGVALLLASGARAQQPSPALPQETPRAVVVLLFLSDDSQALERHLLRRTRAKLARLAPADREDVLQRMEDKRWAISGSLRQVQVHSEGLVLIESEGPGPGQRTEVWVDSEGQSGDRAHLDLSLHVLRNGREESVGGQRRLLLDLQWEEGTWKLARATGQFILPLDDGAYLDALVAGLQNTDPQNRIQNAVILLRSLGVAEAVFASNHPEVGYACSLGQLGSHGVDPDRNDLALMDFADGHLDGYTIRLSGCEGSPAKSFFATLVPDDASAPAFCMDDSGQIRYGNGGRGDSCGPTSPVLSAAGDP